MKQKTRYSLLISSAKRRGIEVNLVCELYDLLISLGCSYCGESLQEKRGVCLDRLDNTKGYLSDNVVPCCKHCNIAKNTMGQYQFFEWIDRVYNHKKKELNEFINNGKQAKDYKKDRNILMNSSKMRNSKILTHKP